MPASTRRPRLAPFFLLMGTSSLALGCDDEKEKGPAEAKAEGEAPKGDAAKGDAAKTDATKADATETDAAPTDAAKADAVPTDTEVEKEVATFLKDQSKKGCEMLTPPMVAKVLGVPEGELDQKPIMGCIYRWKGGGTVGEASIMSLWVKKTPEAARTWFDNSTKSKTAEEIAAEMAKVKEMVADRKEIDTELKKKTAADMSDVIVGMTPDQGYQYDDVPGVGDAARVKRYDGTVTVLVGNLIFSIQAYKGEPAPPPDMAVVMSRDVKKITAAAKQAEAELMDKTRDLRRELSIELAKQVVAAL